MTQSSRKNTTYLKGEVRKLERNLNIVLKDNEQLEQRSNEVLIKLAALLKIGGGSAIIEKAELDQIPRDFKVESAWSDKNDELTMTLVLPPPPAPAEMATPAPAPDVATVPASAPAL